MDAESQEIRAEDRIGWLASPESIMGAAVFDATARRLGCLATIMIDNESGRVSYGIIRFDWEDGESCHALPWRLLQFNFGMAGYVVRVPLMIIKAAPANSGSDPRKWPNRAWRGHIEQYFRTWL